MPQSPMPDRHRIAEDIRDKIRKGREGRDGGWPPGHKLPSLRELISDYSTPDRPVSAEPVRTALLMLQSEGLLVGRRGKGVYVAEQ